MGVTCFVSVSTGAFFEPFLLFGAGFSFTCFGSLAAFGVVVFFAAGVALERGFAFGLVAVTGPPTGVFVGGIEGDDALFEFEELE